MASFNDYRDKWIYFCLNCGLEITAYRDCGKVVPCKCGRANMGLKEFIEGKKVEFEPVQGFSNIQTFRPYYDTGLGRMIESKEQIKEICKREGLVYAGDKEISQEAQRNKKYKEEKFQQGLEKILKDL